MVYRLRQSFAASVADFACVMPPLTLQSKFKNVAGGGRGRAVKNRQSARIPTKWVFKGIVETFSIIGMVGHRKGVRHCKPGDIRGNHFADSATLTAKKVAAAAAAEAAKRNWDAFCIAVVGPSGDLVYFEKLDNCQFASVAISQHKARTAALFTGTRQSQFRLITAVSSRAGTRPTKTTVP
jgi:hypothetical protein